MQIGDIVREKTKMKRPCLLGVVLETNPRGFGSVVDRNEEEYLVHFFDDNDQCWMGKSFLETVSATR